LKTPVARGKINQTAFVNLHITIIYQDRKIYKKNKKKPEVSLRLSYRVGFVKLNVGRIAGGKRLIEETLKSLCLSNRHADGCSADRVLLILDGSGADRKHVATCLLGSVVAINTEVKSGSALLVEVVSVAHVSFSPLLFF
tara:strand:+ start:368 stop:787 length:420 start_codon:yes stop_codon:yes gene_type:complete